MYCTLLDWDKRLKKRGMQNKQKEKERKENSLIR